ncbi:MAG: tyrosine-type recombinase/integrase [Deltaproteobacteria bacterium]|jgi:integrase|nr:tyrosine-type recombinase/integrase [Deltaproteobacteria bacterium]
MKGKLTIASINALKPNGKIQKITDGEGLYLHVSQVGGKVWRFNYRFLGKQYTLTIGKYPAISLKEAREQLIDAKRLLAKGMNPAKEKQEIKKSRYKASLDNITFDDLVTEYLEKRKKEGLKEKTIEGYSFRLNRYVLPYIGKTFAQNLTSQEILIALRITEKKQLKNTAHRSLTLIGQILRYGASTGRNIVDVTQILRGALLAAPPVKHMATTVDPQFIGKLLNDIDNFSGSPTVRIALQLAPIVILRPSELATAEWVDIDFEKAEWRIPAHKTKMKRLHIVPLPKQAIAYLKEAKKNANGSKYLFPGIKRKGSSISPATLLIGLRKMKYRKDEITVHGFRGMASTILNEMGFNPDWVERQLAHKERNSVRDAYNHAEYLSDRRRMLQVWANHLDRLKKKHKK